MLAEDALHIYTDGSSFSSPRKGGVGIRFVLIDGCGRETIDDYCPPGYKGATNNQMELEACTIALREAERLGVTDSISKIIIHTDSMYVSEHYRKAMFEWPKTRWTKRSGEPVLNVDLWKKLVRTILTTGCRVDIQWVQGHAKDEHNKAADKMARRSAQTPVQPPLAHVSVRRKTTAASVERGSVVMRGQRITIRIITCEYLRTHRLWKLKYEVISRSSPFRGRVDIIFSDELLKDGHTYYVRLNDDTSNPRVAKVFRELST